MKPKQRLLVAEISAIGFGAMRMTEWDDLVFPDALVLGQELIDMIEARGFRVIRKPRKPRKKT